MDEYIHIGLYLLRLINLVMWLMVIVKILPYRYESRWYTGTLMATSLTIVVTIVMRTLNDLGLFTFTRIYSNYMINIALIAIAQSGLHMIRKSRKGPEHV